MIFRYGESPSKGSKWFEENHLRNFSFPTHSTFQITILKKGHVKIFHKFIKTVGEKTLLNYTFIIETSIEVPLQ